MMINQAFKACPGHVRSQRNSIKVQAHSGNEVNIDRRTLFTGLAASTLLLSQEKQVLAAGGADAQLVGSYLPPSGIADLVQFTPAKDKTPALRAGVIIADNRYSFALPPTFKESRISNTQNGNFCMPRCAEPWTEVVFEDTKLGKIQLMAVPQLKLTNAKNVKIEDLGSPESLLPRIGPYITGSYFDEDTVMDITSKQQDGVTYYVYDINMPDAMNGPHSLTSVTAKGEVVYLFVLSANEKQWKTSQNTLRTVLDTFKA